MDLASRVLANRVEHRPTLIAIDGRCGAGKSTLAKELADELNAMVLTVDAFHHPREYRYHQGEDSAQGYYEDAFDTEAIVERVLRPLQAGPYPATIATASLDLATNRPVAPQAVVPRDSIVIFEGIFALRRELEPFWDFRILIDTDAETSLGRALMRDDGPAEVTRRKYAVRYEPAWLLYVEGEHPKFRADVILSG